MPLFIFATLGEARTTLESLGARPASDAKVHVWSEGLVPALYDAPHFQIAISGLGTLAALHCVSTYAREHDEIWNFGMAGTLTDTFALGQLCDIGQVSKYLPLPSTLDPISLDIAENVTPQFVVAESGARLLTIDVPLHNAQLRDQLSARSDLVDMEGYGIAYGAHHLGKKCRLWKIVSDPASEHGRKLLLNHKEHLSDLLAEKILESKPLPL